MIGTIDRSGFLVSMSDAVGSTCRIIALVLHAQSSTSSILIIVGSSMRPAESNSMPPEKQTRGDRVVVFPLILSLLSRRAFLEFSCTFGSRWHSGRWRWSPSLLAARPFFGNFISICGGGGSAILWSWFVATSRSSPHRPCWRPKIP